MHKMMGWFGRAEGMALAVLRRAAALTICLTAVSAVHATSLDASLLPKIQGATFEVVAAKPVNDPLTYDKPLPLDLLPFQERNDKYHSIGTAFAIGHNRYVTAGHVLLAGVDSLWGAPSLRDAGGHVYAIDKVDKFDLRRDFVVFSLTGDPAASPLDVDTKPVLNQEVYAVGNALGTGVVIRDGLYTSDTPEQENGAWKWMRFSAAASPGNSGGPLLNKEGKVIGVVLMKSANENLNYALQICDVLSAPEQGAIDQRMPFGFDVFDTALNNSFKAQFALPLSLAGFYEAYDKANHAFIDSQLKEILAKDPEHMFPRGSGANRLLYSNPKLNTVPALVARNGNGEWGLMLHQGAKVPLEANGYLASGTAGHGVMLHFRRPDTMSASQLYAGPGALASQLVKLGPLKRTIGTEQVCITNLGKPTTSTTHTDAWQRHWQVYVWPLAFGNVNLIVFALPVPDGYAIMMRPATASATYDNLSDMRVVTDFVSVAYEGSLAQWKEFVRNGSLLPAALKDVRIGVDDPKRFSYTSSRLQFAITPELQKIGPDNQLTLGLGFLPEHGKVVWDVNDVRVKVNAQDPDRINIQRNIAPPADLDDDYKSEWNKIVQRERPFDAVAYGANGETRIARAAGESSGHTPDVLYTAFYGVSGTQTQDTMKPKLDLLLKDIQIKEH